VSLTSEAHVLTIRQIRESVTVLLDRDPKLPVPSGVLSLVYNPKGVQETPLERETHQIGDKTGQVSRGLTGIKDVRAADVTDRVAEEGEGGEGRSLPGDVSLRSTT
jgi:hypothetical protein